MDSQSRGARSRIGESTHDWKATRQRVLAAGGVVALGGLAGCSAVDALLDSGTEQLVGTTASSPAAFYPGRAPSSGQDTDSDGRSDGEDSQFFVGSDADVRQVPATVRVEGQEIDLEGWSISTATKAQDYNSSRSNKPRTEWWVGPDGDGDSDGDGYSDVLVAIQDVELELLGHVRTAQDAVGQRERAAARAGLDAFLNATSEALEPGLDECGTGVCETVAENSDGRTKRIETARSAIDDGDWNTADAELAAVEEVVLGDIERLDDELEGRRPARPRFSDLIGYLDGDATIGEQFTVCLPDATLPGDRGSLAEVLSLDRVLAYFAASYEDGSKRPPFSDRYGDHGVEYDDDGCIHIDGPVSLHEDVACQNILSATFDTYTTENRAIVGYGTEGGAVVSAAPASSDPIGKRVFLAKSDVTGEIILGEDRDMVMPGSDDTISGSQTLVCPVTVTPEDSPTPLPGLFYVRRIVTDGQIVFAGGWVLDDGALYENSATLLFDEGPTEVASVTTEDIESDDYEDRIVGQFSRERSRYGSGIASTGGQRTGDGRAGPIRWMAPESLRAGNGESGLNGVIAKIIGERGADDGGINDPFDGFTKISEVGRSLDAPIVHLAGAKELSGERKLSNGRKIVREVGKKK